MYGIGTSVLNKGEGSKTDLKDKINRLFSVDTSMVQEQFVTEDGVFLHYDAYMANPVEGMAIGDFLEKMREGGNPVAAANELYKILSREEKESDRTRL